MLTQSDLDAIDEVVAARKKMPGALLPILHGIQDAMGYIPSQAVEGIARELNLSRAEVHGVVTYYHHFRSEPAGRHVLQVCRAESCKAMGSDALWEHACAKLQLPQGHGTTSDGAITLEPVYCLGLCASSPAIVLDEKLHARISMGKLDSLLAHAAAAA